MADATNITMTATADNTEVNEEMDAYRTDVRLAEYAERVEKGMLTPEEKACREAVRKFVGVK